MNPSTYVILAGLVLALVFAALVLKSELTGIAKNKGRRKLLLSGTSPEYAPGQELSWTSEKVLVLTAAAVALVVVLFTK